MKEEFKTQEQVRKEKRRENKKEKKKKQQQSWIQNQKIKKLKKTEIELKRKLEDKLDVPIIDFSGKRDIETMDVDKSPERNQNQSQIENQKSSKLKKTETNSKQRAEKKLKVSFSDVSGKRESVSKSQLALLREPVKKELKSLKRKSITKFDEYLEMETNKGMVSAEEDLRLERKLAKKLKVKRGKLRGLDDEMNDLLEGVPSIIDSAASEKGSGNEDTKRVKKSSLKKKLSAKAEEHQPDSVEAIDSELVREDYAAEVAPEEPPTKAPELTEARKYIAPHLRSRRRNESEEHTQIRRRVRGLLNRLSESNVESITVEMSTIYRSIGRSSGSQIISEEVLASCTGGPRGNEQYAAVFAAFVAGMACSVGIDFSAKVITSLAKTFEDEYLKDDNLSLRNLTLLLSYLYIFGVCSSDLIYDFISILSKRLMEIDVSTILTILQCCGMQLRGDDPSAMKDFILGVQNRVNELKSLSGSMPDDHLKISNKRMEFMLETILDIKNNKKKAKDEPAHYIRIKKWLQKLRVEDVLLRDLKWSKLLDPDKKGQWWLSEDVASTTDKAEEVASTIDREVLEAQKLLQLAAAQRMNTDARRAIFCIIMSGEDYLDAFEKLLRLDLSGKQDREIMRVLLKCCLQEKVFNKYYSVLASKLCSHDKNHKFTLQYCLWDHYKELESMELIQSMNLAKFTAEMLASFSLSLAVLKTVDLSDIKKLTPKTVMHFRMLFESVFELPDSILWNMFTRIALMPELETLRNDIEFFIKQFVASNSKNISKKFKIVKKASSNVEGQLMS